MATLHNCEHSSSLQSSYLGDSELSIFCPSLQEIYFPAQIAPVCRILPLISQFQGVTLGRHDDILDLPLVLIIVFYIVQTSHLAARVLINDLLTYYLLGRSSERDNLATYTRMEEKRIPRWNRAEVEGTTPLQILEIGRDRRSLLYSEIKRGRQQYFDGTTGLALITVMSCV